jgi:hypothetical protein
MSAVRVAAMPAGVGIGRGDRFEGVMNRQRVGGREVYLEFHRVGDYIKVSAIDARTNVEVSIVGSPRTTQRQLTRIAVRKLEYVLDKQSRDSAAKPGRGFKV